MIDSFQGLAQERLLTWEKGSADTGGSQVLEDIFYGKEDIYGKDYISVSGIDEKKEDKDFQF